MIVKNTKRYNKAKIHRLLAHAFINKFILIISVLTAAFGLYLYFVEQVGYSLLMYIPIILVFIISEWNINDLKKLCPKKNGNNDPSDLLNPDVLSRIRSKDIDSQMVIEAIKADRGRIFFYNRFFIVDDILLQADCSIDNWWPMACQLWEQHPVFRGIDGSHITVAIILSANNKDELLKSLKYSEEELIKGLEWYYYNSQTIDKLSIKRKSGGIARDWAAGYTPLLSTFAQNLSYSLQYGGNAHREILSHQNIIDQMVSIFTTAGRSNVALVGQVGVGKHMCVEGLAEQLIYGNVDSRIKYSQIYQIDIASLISQTNKEELDKVISRLIEESYHAKNIILFFNDAGQLFIEERGVDLSNLLLPLIEAGRIKIIFSFNDRDWQFIQRNKPALPAAFNYLAVLATNETETIHILENEAIFVESQYKCLFTYKSLGEIYRLADRYGPDVSMPERAISVMNDSGRTGNGGIITEQIVQSAIEETTGVKVGLATSSEKDVLLNLERQMHQRVIGQEQAITEIVSALKRNRTGVANSSKPIGAFLFLGPTGVGKTEVSKTLAATYFGDENRMVRLDMNEFVNPDSINRLLSAGNQSSPSFLDQIKKQPFTVVLLDEFEKADQSVINAFLQLFDEGVMQDIEGRAVSFKDSIVIATSNAGANYIRQAIDQSINIESMTKQLSDRLVSEGVFKPELINRFDDIVIFKPLSRDQLRNIVNVILSRINQELSNQKISVGLSSELVEQLVARSDDPAMGARPLRRLMQRTIETTVADKILNGQIASGDSITLGINDVKFE